MRHRMSSPAFVGRAEELELLGEALDAVARGRSATVVIGGDAGIGKSRLVGEFRDRARGGDSLVATGTCAPVGDGGLPYGPVVGLLRDLARQVGASGAEVLGPFALDLGVRLPRLGDGGGRAATHEVSKTHLFEAALGGITALAQATPTVLVFEDLHWADSASIELLDFLTRNLGDGRVLILGTYRSEELGHDHLLRRALAELGRHPRVTHMHLGGLDREETARLIAGILGHEPDWVLVDAVWDRSQGNAFFAEELTAARHRTTLSPELREVILARVDTLSDGARRMLQVAAVAGSAVDHRLLAAVARTSDEALDEALAESVDRQVLVVSPDSAGYRFRHTLVREAVEAALLPGERARLHREVARALSADGSLGAARSDGRWADLAGHWWAAGEWEDAFATSVAAADAALALWAFPEALAHFDHALASFDRMPPESVPAGTDRLVLLEKAADAAYLAGETQRSVDLASEAIAAAERLAPTATVAELYAILGRNTWGIGQHQAAFDAYRKAAALLPADLPTPALAKVLAEEARGLMLLSRYQEGADRAGEAITAAQAVGARTEECQALNTRGVCRSFLGYADEGAELLRAALAIAEELGSPELLDRAYTNLSCILVDWGRLAEATQVMRDSLASIVQIGFLKVQGAAANGAEALVRLGRWAEAQVLMEEMGERGIGVCATAPQLASAPLAIRRGQFDQARRLLAQADTRTAGLGDVQTRGLFHMQNAELALEQGRPADAYEHVEQALALAAGTDDESYTPEMCTLGIRALADRLEEVQASGSRIDPDKLRLLAKDLVGEAERVVAAPVARGGRSKPAPMAFLATCLAEASRLQRPNPDLWAHAADHWESMGEVLPTAYCRWREAEAVLEGRSGKGRAAEALRRAWQITVDLGAAPLRQRIERLAQRARIRLESREAATEDPASTLAADLGLTPRELEVLGYLATGHTDREIAEALFISKKTASVHVSNLLRKLDAANRVEAGRLAQTHGLG